MAPRYSIIRGDFPEDPRASLVHFRVYTLIGRHTDSDGWCRLKQLAIGEAVGYSRKTVNEAIADLVAWGYVEKCAQDATGRAIWYRTIMDRPAAPPVVESGAATETEDGACDEDDRDEGPVTPALQAGCNSEGGPVTLQVTPGVTTRGYTERPLLNDLSPLPHGARATGDKSDPPDLKKKAAALIAALRADRAPESPVEHLLRPILEQRRFSAADRHAELMQLARSAKALSRPALEKAAEIVLGLGIVTIKPQRIADAIDKVRKGGAMVPIRRGTPQWQRWAEHFETADPRQGALMGRFDVWQVPSEWPPRSGLTPLDAAPAGAADDSRSPSAPLTSPQTGRDAA